MRLLIVEDKADLAALTRRALIGAGFAVDIAPGPAGAEDHVAVAPYDAIVLDLGLIDGNGLILLQRLRRSASSVPILILTARDAPEDRVTGLDEGADDYLVKPFHMAELVSRLRALLRRPNAVLGVRLELGNVALDTTSRQTTVTGVRVLLPPRETALLELLLRHQGNAVTRETLEQSLHDFGTTLGSNALEVLVHRLRRRLAEAGANAVIHTLRGWVICFPHPNEIPDPSLGAAADYCADRSNCSWGGCDRLARHGRGSQPGRLPAAVGGSGDRIRSADWVRWRRACRSSTRSGGVVL
jgi:DNA-binding response OmpR family regulator